MVWGHNCVLGNVIHNEEIPTRISIQRSQSNNNMKVSYWYISGKTFTFNNIIHLLCSIFMFCTFQQKRFSTGSFFELFCCWNTSRVFIGILGKLFIMLHIVGSWPAFASVTQEHRTWGQGWKGKENISRNDNSERYDMKYWVLWTAFF